MNTLRLVTRSAAGARTDADNQRETVNDTAVNSTALQTYCTQIILQPDLEFGGVPEARRSELPPTNEHFATARANATRFLDEVNPGMWQAVSDIGGYGNAIEAFQIEFDPLLEQLQGGDDDARPLIVELLEGLRGEAGARMKRAEEVIDSLNGVRDDFAGDAANFRLDALKVNALIEGDNGVLMGIMEQLDEQNAVIDGAIAGVVVSVIGIVGGGLLIVFTAGTLSTVGTGLVVTGVAGTIASSVILGVANATKRDLLAQQSELMAEVAALAETSSVLQTLQGRASAAVATVQALANAWGDMSSNLVQQIGFAQSAEAAEAAVTIRAFVRAIQKQWRDLRTLSVNLQTRFQSLDTREVTDITDPSQQAA